MKHIEVSVKKRAERISKSNPLALKPHLKHRIKDMSIVKIGAKFKLNQNNFFQIPFCLIKEDYMTVRYLSYVTDKKVYSIDKENNLSISDIDQVGVLIPDVTILTLPNTGIPKHLLVKHSKLFSLVRRMSPDEYKRGMKLPLELSESVPNLNQQLED